MEATHVLLARAESTPASPAEQFLGLVSDPFRTTLQGTAFLSSLITSVIATAAIGLVFCFLRPYNSVVYAPRLRHADEKHAPPPIGKSPFAWIPAIAKTKEQVMVDKVGMDAAVFLRVTRMFRNMFLLLTVVGCGILIPTYLVSGKTYSSAPGINSFMKMTPQFLVGKVFWAIVVISWIIDLVVCAFLWWNYRAVARLRQHYFTTPEYQTSLHSRTLMVTDITKSARTDEGVVRVVDSVKANGTIPKGSIGRNVRDLPDLIEEHEEHVRELEEVLAKYLKNPDKLPMKRPMCKVSEKDTGYAKGTKVDAIEYLTSRIQHLEKKIKDIRSTIDTRDAENYGFASYESIEEAHSVAFAAKGKKAQGATIDLAPRPNDIIWNNLNLTPATRKSRAITNNLWITLLTLIFFVPNALIAVFLANLGNLGLLWPAFDQELRRHDKGWALVQGVLAPALSSLIYWALPRLFRQLSMKAGDKSKTSRDRHVMSKLFAFFVFNNLIMFSLFGALFQFVAAVVNARNQQKDVLSAIKSGDIWTKLMIALCNVSPYWASWLLQRNLGAAIDLAQLVNLAWGGILRRFSSPTPRQLIELSAPPPFDYASYYNYFLFYSAVTLCFATIQPIVIPITAFYFSLDAWLKKYLLMYVFTTKTESGGRFWRPVFNRTLVGALMSNIIVALMVYARRGGTGNEWITMLCTMIPLPLLLLAFKFYCRRTFDTDCEFYMLGRLKGDETTLDDDKSRRSDRISIRFGHPALYKPLMTPMVHAKSQHMLAKIYAGRLDEEDDDVASMAGYSDAYSMHSMARNHQRKISKMSGTTAHKQPEKRGPFEFVSEQDMDFENFKNRSDFRSEFGGDGEMYGRAEDATSLAGGSRSGTPVHGFRPGDSRSGTPVGHTRGSPSASAGIKPVRPGLASRDSERTLSETTYPRGYAPPTPRRPDSVSPERSGVGAGARNQSSGNINLLHDAAPMGADVSRSTTPAREYAAWRPT